MVDTLPPTFAIVGKHNHLSSAGLFTTLATTLWTTILISYRIYSTSKHTRDEAKSHFYHVMEMIIQSSFIYSLALATNALLVVIPRNELNNWTISIASTYAGVILSAVTVCRIANY